uniref:alpha-ketoglutarate-dependent dioxygenase AlkB family protein n=1 Tax=Flavobacterium sp. TaxID=239 RepID=UPI004049ECD3
MELNFDENTNPIVFKVPDAEIWLKPQFLNPLDAAEIFFELLQKTPWQHDKIVVFGKEYDQPRLTALYGNEGKPYQYSNITMTPNPWTSLLLDLKNKIEKATDHVFTTVLINLYRDGQDSNGWHADNEKELGENPVIASLSLGQKRMFHLKHNSIKDEKLKIELSPGSLLVMKGTTQHFWKHQIPKTAKLVGPRINLTFRTIV